ncbi:redoxin family protein [Sporosarcina cyprini]|uniref:redoxin family protein n=1 Tax=Sporosarcina cyprini TaxID=2910523 RepID=UPI001EDDE8E9|nr:redoxin family protein [Sporosarcina cyprini]MCG3086374.1 redoxin family protein [Sporosarcina cyprini]
MKLFKKLILVSAVLLALAGCSQGSSSSSSSPEQAANAKLAPDFELKDLNGKVHQLSDYQGQQVYVKFWASWCPICLAGLEELNTLAGEDHDFAVLTIVSPGYNNEKETKAFEKWFKGVENTENITVLLDEGGEFTKKYGVRGYPTSVFISSKGELLKTQPGHMSNEQIISTFEEMD